MLPEFAASMDSDGGCSRNSSPEEKNPKRRMKTPFQLEALERVYAEDRYPTESVRAELSVHLNLSDQQLQMWFCHRRLKEKKGKEGEAIAGRKKQKMDHRSGHTFDARQTAVLEPEVVVHDAGVRDPDNDYYEDFEVDHGWMSRSENTHRRETDGLEATFVARKESEKLFGKARNPRTVAGNVAVAAVKSYMGERLRDDGPELGVDFDSLPLGAFGSSIEGKSERRPPTVPPLLNENRVEERRVEERQETHPSNIGIGLPPLPATVKRKGGFSLGEQNVKAQHLPRASEEVQFFPEQPIATEDEHRHTQLNLHQHSDRSYDMVPASTVRSLSHLGSFLPLNMHSTSGNGYGFQQERVDNFGISLLPPGESKASGLFANGFGLGEGYWRGNYGSFSLDGHGAIPQSTMQGFGANQLSVGFESLALFQEQEQARLEKKRKREELKLAKESEAYAKRMRRDLERQEVLRHKKEEQMRRELEKQDRDKRKEEERAERERQREVERIEREQKREIERKEKIALKESKRMEKQHRRDELRKVKEAARLKAATERAAAKKLSKEWMDTVEDEQLELLEASTFHGLECGDAENDFSNVLLKKFPPPSVRMKPALSFCSWNGLDHIAGHFFMVWRFLTTFADVIGLWPFTVDEFVQALCDFDPRLLSEIHVCLIKMIVKDIEDAAQAAASGAGGSQNAINLISGGHPQIVEAAYEWGFDIREWGKHVSPLTWPDILRQFALAAGYGPKWRRRSKGMIPAEEPQEHIEEESAVTVLRSGVAAANAAALMQGKGVGNLRRCRHRLTPGTVKYAAFHVLSLEGSKGLTILEVAEKIQKSGLRDLTTSKTPEASIAAALSRDTKLFERVAPSTYCVLPVFRKDAEDAEEVLQAARERIDLFQSGMLDGEEADKEADETEEMERDEDYDSDGQDVEDADLRTSISKDSDAKLETQAELMSVNNLIDEEVEVDESQVGDPWVQGLMEGEYSDLSVEERLMALVALVNVVNEGNAIRLALEARMEASGTLKRQIWAETQIDRRRHKEEQLSRIQPGSLVPSKNDGLSVGADAGSGQIITLDEKPDEHVIGIQNGTDVELNAMPFESAIAPEGPATGESNIASQEKNLAVHEKDTLSQEGLIPRETAQGPCSLTERPRAQVKPDVGILAEELYMIRSLPLGLDRRRNRYWQFVSCGGEQDPSQGRIFVESVVDGHWEIIDTEEALDTLLMSLDVRGTREAALHAVLGRLDGSLRRGMTTIEASRSSSRGHGKSDFPGPGVVSDIVREAGTSAELCQAGADSNSIKGQGLQSPATTGVTAVDLEKIDFEKQSSFERLKDFERWIWSENLTTLSSIKASKFCRKRDCDVLEVCTKCHGLYWAADKHCQPCHQTQSKTQSKQDLHTRDCEGRPTKKGPLWQPCGSSIFVPPRIQVLKCNIISVEVAVPLEAWKDLWDPLDRKVWASSVKCARTPADLLHALEELESRMEPDWLSSLDDTSEESLSASKSSCLAVDAGFPPWVPRTSAAVGLRVKMVFDAALALSSEQKRSQKQVEEDEQNVLRTRINGPVSHTMHDVSSTDSPGTEDSDEVLGNPTGGRGRGRGSGRGRGRGRKGKGVRRSDTNLIQNGTPRNVQKNSKRKHQEEISAASTKDVRQVKIGGRGQGGTRGRPRGNCTGRPRGRGSRGAHRNQSIIKRMRRLRKEKDPNELIPQKATSKKSSVEQSKLPAGGDINGECENDALKKSEWDLEDSLEVEDDENVNTIVKEDGDGEGEPDEGDMEVVGLIQS